MHYTGTTVTMAVYVNVSPMHTPLAQRALCLLLSSYFTMIRSTSQSSTVSDGPIITPCISRCAVCRVTAPLGPLWCLLALLKRVRQSSQREAQTPNQSLVLLV